MGDYKDILDRLQSLVDELTNGPATLDVSLRYQTAQGQRDVDALTGTIEITVVGVTSADAYISAASFVTETASAADGNSRNMELLYDDGAGGAAVSLSTDFDNTATAITAGQMTSLVVTPLVSVPAGSRIYFNCTHNGTGVILDETECFLEYYYQ
jgi:hypothetical protein